MWNFLRPGQSGAAAADAIDGLLQELARVEEDQSLEHVVAANAYLIWAEKVEQQLLSIYEGFASIHHLHSDRYWQIRSITASSSRPMQLIRAEIKVQARYLEGLVSQLRHYTALVSFSPDHWIVVPDTNVYIHGKLFQEIEWNREIDADQVSLVMPLVVLDELDKIKDRDHQFGKRARSVLRALDGLTDGKNWLNPIRLRRNVWLQLLDEPADHLRQLVNDDEIVRQAGYFAQLNEHRLVIVTRDRGMRLRAQAVGLKNVTLPERLERIRQSFND